MAVAPRTPLIAPKPAEGSRGTHAARSTVAITITTAPATSWLRASGRKPADSGIWARTAKRTPKPSPASTPSTAPEARGPPPSSSRRGSRATSQMPGRATTIPSQTRAEGRSPVATPTTTGTSVAPTPETGATTPIRPDERPRYRKPVPMPLATPATRAQLQVARSGIAPDDAGQGEDEQAAGELRDQRHAPRAGPLGGDTADEVGEPVRRGRPEREQDRGHVTTTPTTQVAAASRPDDELDEDAEADGPECRPGGGTGRGRADPPPLGEVEPEHEAEEQAEDRDDEEADDAQRPRRSTGSRPGCRRP